MAGAYRYRTKTKTTDESIKDESETYVSHDDTVEETGDFLDEVDGLLEEMGLEFAENYKQKGGQ